MNQFIRTLIFNILYYLGFAHLLFYNNRAKKRIPIILFHRVSPKPSPCWPPLTPKEFEQTIKLLYKYYTFYSLDDILNPSIKKKRNAACIVFDDGYCDFKEYAFPVLVKYKTPTTLFIPTHNIDKQEPLWTSIIDDILTHAEQTYHKTDFKIFNQTVTLLLSSNKELFTTANAVKNILYEYSYVERDFVIERLKNQLNLRNQIPHEPMLSWEEIAEMKKKYPELLNIQSHTHTHPYLPSLNEIEIENELLKSYKILSEQKFNSTDKIAYPMGGFSKLVLEKTAQHYKFGFAVKNQHYSQKKL